MKPRDYEAELARYREQREIERAAAPDLEEEPEPEEPGQEEDEVRQWRTYTVTRQWAARMRKEREQLEALLFRAAMASPDPNVRGLAATLNVVKNQLEYLERGTS